MSKDVCSKCNEQQADVNTGVCDACGHDPDGPRRARERIEELEQAVAAATDVIEELTSIVDDEEARTQIDSFTSQHGHAWLREYVYG